MTVQEPHPESPPPGFTFFPVQGGFLRHALLPVAPMAPGVPNTRAQAKERAAQVAPPPPTELVCPHERNGSALHSTAASYDRLWLRLPAVFLPRAAPTELERPRAKSSSVPWLPYSPYEAAPRNLSCSCWRTEQRQSLPPDKQPRDKCAIKQMLLFKENNVQIVRWDTPETRPRRPKKAQNKGKDFQL
ncbi:hypothetical protein GN956_G12419 [Arapaima gigas]